MGFANEHQASSSKSGLTDRGTIICSKCTAEYCAHYRWLKGRIVRQSITDSGQFHPTSLVPAGHCPICGTKYEGVLPGSQKIVKGKNKNKRLRGHANHLKKYGC